MDPKVFEMKMRGLPIDFIAAECGMTSVQVESEINDMFPTFEMETNAWLEALEEVCLFRGMNSIKTHPDTSNIGISNLPNNSLSQVEYLKLALDVRLCRYEKWRENVDDLESTEEFGGD